MVAALRASLLAAVPWCAPVPVTPGAGAFLKERLARIVGASDGEISITVLNLRTGERASVAGQAARPMTSVFKLPLAVAALVDVDQGLLRFDQLVPLGPSELRRGGPIAEAWQRGEKAPSVESLLKHMLQESDNTAGDKLVRMLGGGASITSRLRKVGLDGITVSGPEIARDAALACAGEPAPDGGWTLDEIAACPAPSASALAAAVQSEVDSPPDSASSDALVELLSRLNEGTILAGDSRVWLLSTLADVHTGPSRLRAGVAADARLAHKTGTGVTTQGVTIAMGDVGIVTPRSGDPFAIAVLVAGSRSSLETQEAIIARLARVTWNTFAGR